MEDVKSVKPILVDFDGKRVEDPMGDIPGVTKTDVGWPGIVVFQGRHFFPEREEDELPVYVERTPSNQLDVPG